MGKILKKCLNKWTEQRINHFRLIEVLEYSFIREWARSWKMYKQVDWTKAYPICLLKRNSALHCSETIKCRQTEWYFQVGSETKEWTRYVLKTTNKSTGVSYCI